MERFWSGDRRGWTGEDEINACRLEPVAVFVEVGVDARGADDGVGGFEWNVLMVFEHAFEDAAELRHRTLASTAELFAEPSADGR